jgi:PAS domain-containing protein
MTPSNPVVTIENRVLVANDEMRWMQFINRGFFDTAGILKETQAVGRDITMLKQMEANLRESEETLQRAQAVGRIGSFTMANDTETFRITQETARLFGLGDSGVTTFAEWFSRVHPDDQGNVETAWRAALNGAPYDMIYRIVVEGQTR